MTYSSETDRLANLRSELVTGGLFSFTPHFAVSGQGAQLVDAAGRTYIDLAGGLGTLNVGHCHPKVVAAVKDQVDRLMHTCAHVMMPALYLDLAEELCRVIPGNYPKKVMLVNSGSEAIENAIKAARAYTRRPALITFDCAFHGRTILCLSLTSKVKPLKYGLGPLVPEIYRLPFAYCYRCPLGLSYPVCGTACADIIEDYFVKHVAADDVAALIVEPITGEGGFIVPPPEYFPRLAAICKSHGIIFIADEVQSGMGRTGHLLAIEHWGVEPDLVVIAKSLAAGLPLSAVVGRRDILDAPPTGSLGGTYGGNPLACRAALAVFEIIREEDLLSKARQIGLTLRAQLENWQKKYALIGDVRGLGAMMAMELVKDREKKTPATVETRSLINFCHQRGVVILSCGNYANVIRFLTPLIITSEQLTAALAVIEAGLAAIEAGQAF